MYFDMDEYIYYSSDSTCTISVANYIVVCLHMFSNMEAFGLHCCQIGGIGYNQAGKTISFVIVYWSTVTVWLSYVYTAQNDYMAN